MGYPRIADNSKFIDYTIVSVTSEDPNAPISSIKTYKYPSQSWRSTSLVQQDIVIDLATQYENPVIYMDNFNFTTFQIHGSSDGINFPYSVSITATKNKRLKDFRYIKDLSGFNYQYLRLRIPSQSPASGEAFFLLGGFSVLSSMVTLGEYFEYSETFLASIPGITVSFAGGGVDAIALGARRAGKFTPTVQRTAKVDQSDVSEIYDNFLMSEPVLLDLNRGDPTEAYLMINSNFQLSDTWVNYGIRNYQNLELQVVV